MELRCAAGPFIIHAIFSYFWSAVAAAVSIEIVEDVWPEDFQNVEELAWSIEHRSTSD